MVRLDDVTAAAPVSEADLLRLLADRGDDPRSPPATRTAKASLVARWTIDVESARPVCHWVVEP